MERLTLTPQHTEIVINSGATDGAVDLFSYTPDLEPGARTLGSLSVIGWRQADTSTMGYIISLVAAMARREYYAQLSAEPKEAFTRTLHRVNEVVDEFLKSNSADLAIGIFAIAGSNLMISKLDKFKILLSRDGEVIDILNNIGLFTKEHLERRQFSSIISGSLQPGDRLLAYHPSRRIAARERILKTLLGNEAPHAMTAKLEDIGRMHPEFSASFCRIDMAQVSEPTVIPEPVQHEQVAAAVPPVNHASLTWAPRQTARYTSSETQHEEQVHANTVAAEPEVPNIISTEFALGTRQHMFSRLLRALRYMRLDTRGKAVVLGIAALVIAGGTLVARTFIFISPQEQQIKKLTEQVNDSLKLAHTKVDQHQSDDARQLLIQSLTTVNHSTDLKGDKRGETLTANIMGALDALDNAQPSTPTSFAQLDPQTDTISLALWSSLSQSTWAVTKATDESMSVIEIQDGTVTNRTALTSIAHPDLLIAYPKGVLVMDMATRSITHVQNGFAATPFTIPTEDTIRDAVAFGTNIYILTDHTILKLSDIDTPKPVTKTWLTQSDDLAPNAAHLWVDGSVYTVSTDGTLATYYKGKKSSATQTSLRPSGRWSLVPITSDTIGIANADRGRVYEISITDGTLQRTLKLDSQQTPTLMAPGPDSSVLFLTSDNRLWKLQ